ncbi:antibiotic biosynthesis monooxygenase [Lipingzhangella sp. LS1_29]|uniref:Antibiotic biosynthesis monooxygenase n=1 Tax=Lipingzhangella rawalii TaxID=2055835 RepID=A0ABU2H9F0_9ACTN|nr:antibiotic biosynthesis monooxygenase [Lipingzhangella rawalii]MDS1271911.1 antibiotic biosynthesis monooxygenase [Lipingzhangella rawalii]
MFQIGLSVLVALGAWSVTAALGLMALRRQRLFAWIVVGAGAVVASSLTAAVLGAILGFSPALFRLLHLGMSLVGPLGLAWAAVELVTRSPRRRFAFRNLLAILFVLPVVVLMLEPVTGDLAAPYPPVGDHYGIVARFALTVVHAVVLITLLALVVSLARRSSLRLDRLGGEPLAVVLFALAALAMVLVGHYGLGVFGQLLAGLAVGCVVAGMSVSPDDDHDLEDEEFLGDDFFDEDEDEDSRTGRTDHTSGAQSADDPVAPQRRGDRRGRGAGRGGDQGMAAATTGGVGARNSRVRGVITIYTLNEGHEAAFDRLAGEVVEQVRSQEPDTLLYTCHTVPSAAHQRIMYAIYRDDLAYEEHQQQAHNLEFGQLAAQHIVATNVIELGLLSGKAEETLNAMLATGR